MTPTYDYQCPTCDQHTTITASIKDTITAPVCTHCGDARTQRLYTPPAVEFKGTGWGSKP